MPCDAERDCSLRVGREVVRQRSDFPVSRSATLGFDRSLPSVQGVHGLRAEQPTPAGKSPPSPGRDGGESGGGVQRTAVPDRTEATSSTMPMRPLTWFAIDLKTTRAQMPMVLPRLVSVVRSLPGESHEAVA
jgi:hypothetical protein